MNDNRFASIGPAWINNLRWDIKEKTAQREDVELMMSYYCHLLDCHLFDSKEKNHYEILKLINQIFEEYLDRTANNKQMYRTLDAAFGFTGKQGARDVYQRNQEIATDVARYYLRGKSLKSSILKVCLKYNLGETAVTDAWRFHNMDGIWDEQKMIMQEQLI